VKRCIENNILDAADPMRSATM